MNGLRNSIFNKALIQFEKNELTKKMIYFIIQIGLGDFVYRTFSPQYLKNRREFYKQNEDRIRKNIEALSEEKSKDIYKRLLKYRCEKKRKIFPEFEKTETYFPKDIIELGSDEVFIDCGTYIGDTIDDFLKKSNNNYKKIVCFEPDKENFRILNEYISNKENIYSYEAGVYSDNIELKFNVGKNESSNISEEGTSSIECLKLDSLSECQDATFIKMDIEGAELEALKGAEELIKRNKPKLAICLYHSDQDMIDIIEYVHKLIPEYKIYVRQYSLYEAQTVMYAII